VPVILSHEYVGPTKKAGDDDDEEGGHGGNGEKDDGVAGSLIREFPRPEDPNEPRRIIEALI
jgi:hypothetical protein